MPKTEAINKQNYVSIADNVMQDIIGNPNISLTTSQIRKLLSMSAELYNKTVRMKDDKLSEDIQAEIQYLRMQIAYQAGRDERRKNVYPFVNQSELLIEIGRIDDSKEKLIVFCRYLEALVAYHRFYGGKDK